MRRPLIVLGLLLIPCWAAHAQPGSRANLIRLNAGAIDTSAQQTQARAKSAASAVGKQLRLIQFSGPIQPEWLADLEKSGMRIVDYIPENAYLVYGDAPAVQAMQSKSASRSRIRWEGAYRGIDKVHPRAKSSATRRDPTLFSIQLVSDPESNAATLALIDQLQLAPLTSKTRNGKYCNLIANLPPGAIDQISEQSDVISIHPYSRPVQLDERQAVILAGHVSNNVIYDNSNGQFLPVATNAVPTAPGYMQWLADKGFTQEQFDASDLVVDVSDGPIDTDLTNPRHFALYRNGTISNNSPSRIVYSRFEGQTNETDFWLDGQGHGTGMAHVIAGQVNLVGPPHVDTLGYRYGLGVAPFVKIGSSMIFSSAFTNLIMPYRSLGHNAYDLAARAYRDGARISNNSWGSGSFATYDVSAQEYDSLVRDAQPPNSAVPVEGNQQMTFVFAAGNVGPDASSISAPSTGKNVMSVGASENVRGDCDNANDIADYSGRGPCEDGRIKPDLMAPGSCVTTGIPQKTKTMEGNGGKHPFYVYGDSISPAGQEFYSTMYGTSISAAAVSGAVALVYQWFINRGWATAAEPASPAMIKAYLMNSARYMAQNTEDSIYSNNQGMGMVNLDTAFDGTPRLLRDQCEEDVFTSSGQSWTWTGRVATGDKPLRVTLAWTDAPGSTTGAAYNNDLNLTVVVNGVHYLGNKFNGAHSVAGGDHDPRNNVESVFLPAGTTGEVIVTVAAANINSDGVPNYGTTIDQDFALVGYNVRTSTSTFDMVRVGDEGNVADAEGRGSVDSAFNIGKFEVTLGQYADFLNHVARRPAQPWIADLWHPGMATNAHIAGISRSGSGTIHDPFAYSVIGGENRPVCYVNWFDTARFVNWLHNGATESSDTETGAYTLNGATNGPALAKNANAGWWIPTENEWYKAAYYKGGGLNVGYWAYPTQSDIAPGNNVGSGANQANYYAAGKFAVTQAPNLYPSQSYLTEAGAFSMTPGVYGTYDQGGNVWEWNDLAVGGGNTPGQAGLRGGAWDDTTGGLKADRFYDTPTREEDRVGFRVAGAAVSDEADLSGLILSPDGYSSFQPEFQLGTSTFTASLPFSVTELSVKPVAAREGARLQARLNGGTFSVIDSLVGFKASSLRPGLNTIEVRAIAPSGLTAKTYRVLVSRGNSNANLAAMTLSTGTLSPAFLSAEIIYSANVANETALLAVTPTTAHPGAALQLRLNGGEYVTMTSGSPSKALLLNVGMNDVQLKVTSEDGSSTKIYNITITRAFSSNANLSAINLSSGTLSPAFSAGTGYAASVDFWSKTITLTPNVEQADATVQVRVNGGAYSSVNNSTASSSLALGVGKNTIEVKVTAQDGTTTKTYAIEVTRDPMIIQTVAVGDAGNAPDITGYGAVSYPYRIGKYEITLGEYAEFLNAVANTSDPYGLYPMGWGGPELMRADVAGISRDSSNGVYTYTPVTPIGVNPAGADSPANRPVSFMTLFNAARFANWLANGQPSGGQDATTTEDGAYALKGATSGAITRNATNPNTGAPPTWWIPTENEWYKAAYYKGGGTNAGYWLYPTQNDTKPGNTIGAASNQANHKLLNGAGDAWVYSVPNVVNALYSQNALTDVGAFSNSASAYGTFDQGGNVWEWNYTQVGDGYLIRGGDYGSANVDSRDFLKSSADQVLTPANWKGYSGFRVATLPTAVASPRILSISRGVNGFSLSWTNAPTVHVQRRASLSTGAWETISSNNTSGTHLDTVPPANRGFYRLIVP